jgi:hypothetical protein
MTKLKISIIPVIMFVLFNYFNIFESTQLQKLIVKLTQPPVGQFKQADLWNATIISNSNETYRIYLYGTLTEKKAGLIATGTTTDFDIKNGTKQIKGSDFPQTPDINYPNKDPKYKEAMIKKGSLPPGDYTYCLYAKLKKNNEELGNDCIDFIIEDLGMISLLTPGNEEEINTKAPLIFTWMSTNIQRDANYTLEIAEIREGQTPEVALQTNKLWFEKSEIKTPTFQYPSSAKTFDEGKKYVWYVSIDNIRSDISTFTFGINEVKGEIDLSEEAPRYDYVPFNFAGADKYVCCNNATFNLNGTVPPGYTILWTSDDNSQFSSTVEDPIVTPQKCRVKYTLAISKSNKTYYDEVFVYVGGPFEITTIKEGTISSSDPCNPLTEIWPDVTGIAHNNCGNPVGYHGGNFCGRDVSNLEYIWNTGATTSSIKVDPRLGLTYTVTVSNACFSKTASVTPTLNNPPFTGDFPNLSILWTHPDYLKIYYPGDPAINIESPEFNHNGSIYYYNATEYLFEVYKFNMSPMSNNTFGGLLPSDIYYSQTGKIINPAGFGNKTIPNYNYMNSNGQREEGLYYSKFYLKNCTHNNFEFVNSRPFWIYHHNTEEENVSEYGWLKCAGKGIDPWRREPYIDVKWEITNQSIKQNMTELKICYKKINQGSICNQCSFLPLLEWQEMRITGCSSSESLEKNKKYRIKLYAHKGNRDYEIGDIYVLTPQ